MIISGCKVESKGDALASSTRSTGRRGSTPSLLPQPEAEATGFSPKAPSGPRGRPTVAMSLRQNTKESKFGEVSPTSQSSAPPSPSRRRMSTGSAQLESSGRSRSPSSSRPSSGAVTRKNSNTPDTALLLPSALHLHFWQLVYLGRDHHDVFHGAVCAPWYDLLDNRAKGLVLRLSACLGLRPTLAHRISSWLARARATARGFCKGSIAETDAEYLMEVIQREGIVTAVTNEGKKKTTFKRQQANPEMASPEMLEKRLALKNNPIVQQSITRLWTELPKCPQPYEQFIDRQIYSWLSLRIIETTLPEQEREGALSMIVEDWWCEANLEWFMDYDAFFEGMFAFVDVWCNTACEKDYKKKIGRLIDTVTTHRHQFTHAMKLAERHWVEWLVKAGYLTEAERFAKEPGPPSHADKKARVTTMLSPVEYPYLCHWKYNASRRRSTVGSPAGTPRQGHSRANSVESVDKNSSGEEQSPPESQTRRRQSLAAHTDHAGCSKAKTREKVSSKPNTPPRSPPSASPEYDRRASTSLIGGMASQFGKQLAEKLASEMHGGDPNEDCASPLHSSGVQCKRDLLKQNSGGSCDADEGATSPLGESDVRSKKDLIRAARSPSVASSASSTKAEE